MHIYLLTNTNHFSSTHNNKWKSPLELLSADILQFEWYLIWYTCLQIDMDVIAMMYEQNTHKHSGKCPQQTNIAPSLETKHGTLLLIYDNDRGDYFVNCVHSNSLRKFATVIFAYKPWESGCIHYFYHKKIVHF